VSRELVLYFFSFRKKTAGENSMRVYRTCSVFFYWRVSIEIFLFLFLMAGENSMRDLGGGTLYLLYKVGEGKKRFSK
jgi:hypothetical protein